MVMNSHTLWSGGTSKTSFFSSSLCRQCREYNSTWVLRATPNSATLSGQFGIFNFSLNAGCLAYL